MSQPGIWITRLTVTGGSPRVAVKDLFDTAGVRTTYGSAVFAEHVPERTATAVERLDAAGYVTAGKANLHEFAYGVTSQNPHYGTVPNPAAPGRVAGGSSGGSAAALLVGEAELGLGTDSGGSIRIPAACCGVVGFKPTWDTVPIAGCFPLAPSFDHVGPLARDVDGCCRAMEALAGVTAETVSLRDIRVGVGWLGRADPEIRECVSRAAARFPRWAPIDLPRPNGVFPAFQREIADVHRELFTASRDRYGANVAAKIERCLAVSDAQDAAARAARERYREAVAGTFEGLDLIVTPTLPIVPPPVTGDELDLRERLTENTFPFNAVGAPAIALPCGPTAHGLPASIQLAGAPGADALVLGAAKALEPTLGHTAASREEPEERGT